MSPVRHAAADGRVTRAEVVAALADVPDPEIPAVSIVELGMIGDVEVEAGRVRVELLPTFVGCPALELIRTATEDRLATLAPGIEVEVAVSFVTPWSTDRISPEGREKLRRSGFAPPPHLGGRGLPILDMAQAGATRTDAREAEPVACPYCGSVRTTLENAFGPTQCRSIRHCADCRQPFEAFKPI